MNESALIFLLNSRRSGLVPFTWTNPPLPATPADRRVLKGTSHSLWIHRIADKITHAGNQKEICMISGEERMSKEENSLLFSRNS